MTEPQALLTLGTVTIALALLLLFRLHGRLNPIDQRGGRAPSDSGGDLTGQIPVRELTDRLPLDYIVVSVDGETVVSLPSAEPRLAVFAGGALMGGAYGVQSVVWLLTSSSDRSSDIVGIAVGLLFVVCFGYVSWPALVRKRLRADLGRLGTEWALPVGPALWTRDTGVTRLIVRQGRWSSGLSDRLISKGSTDQVVIDDGARRYVAESVWNLPAYGSFRWFNNWKVAGSPPSARSDPTKPWRSVSPVVLALAGQLANAVQVPVYFEIGKGRRPLISIGDE